MFSKNTCNFRLIDGTNVTVSDEHMWLIPFTEGQNHTVTVNFGQKVMISGLRLWNYNKSKEDTYRGVGGHLWFSSISDKQNDQHDHFFTGLPLMQSNKLV